MKELKLSFPYPSTSRHNLSQDIGMSLSMGLVVPARVVEVLPGDSHRIGTSFSLISNPLVKPLLQGVNMRYCRFWVPRRIYNLALRANNMGYSPIAQGVRYANTTVLRVPGYGRQTGQVPNTMVVNTFASNFQVSSLFDYLGLHSMETGVSWGTAGTFPTLSTGEKNYRSFSFNCEPYIAYYDICRNFFSDSANGLVAFMTTSNAYAPMQVGVGDLSTLDDYIDSIQNSDGTQAVSPYVVSRANNEPAYLLDNDLDDFKGGILQSHDYFDPYSFRSHFGLCVPLLRPDRLSRMFSLRPLTEQNATIASDELTIGNLSFLAKLQRYLTRVFYGGSRFTDVMYSVFGQRVPHVDSPILLDVFDYEIGSELVSSTNATDSQNPGILGGYFSSAGVLKSGRGSSKKRYTFNESGYLIDLVYIMPRLYRSHFYPDFYPVSGVKTEASGQTMRQGNFVPDFNGIGWQQPAFNSISFESPGIDQSFSVREGYCCEPSWQQYRTLPDVCHGLLNPSLGLSNVATNGLLYSLVGQTRDVNSPIYVFTDYFDGQTIDKYKDNFCRLADLSFTSPMRLNRIFGVSTDQLIDNIFVVFRYAHQAKRQVTKRFTLNFS